MNEKKEVLTQFCRFAAVGIFTFIMEYAMLAIFVDVFRVEYLPANALAFTIAILLNYSISIRFVFESNNEMGRMRELAIFLGLSFVGLAINQGLMWIAVDGLGIYYKIAKVLATMMVTCYNFVSRKMFLE